MLLKRLPSSGWKGLQSWSKIYQLRQDPIADLSYRVGMPPFIYRCPNTGLNVQGWVADDPTEGEGEIYARTVVDRVRIPRRSKNGTPEERAAKKASAAIVAIAPRGADRIVVSVVKLLRKDEGAALLKFTRRTEQSDSGPSAA